MDEKMIDRAEQLLSYFEHHGEDMTYGTTAAHREWWMGEAGNLLRDLLPEWSAFKTADV